MMQSDSGAKAPYAGVQGGEEVRGFKAITALLSASLTIASTAFAAIQSTSDFRPDEIIVKYKDRVRRSRFAMESIYSSVSVVKVKRFSGVMRNFEHLIVDEGTDLKEAIEDLEKSPEVEYAQPNYILRVLPIGKFVRPSISKMPCIPGMEVPECEPIPCILPNFPPGCEDDDTTPTPIERPPLVGKPSEPSTGDDVELAKVYGISKIGAPAAWAKGYRGSQGMIVAVIDTGVDYNHAELSFNMWRNPNPDSKANDIVGFDFVHNDGLPYDDHAHGSHCAGVIGAVGNDGKGISGVSQRVSIMALKFLDAEGSGDTAGAIKAIDYAIAHGAKVLSNSWGGKGDDDNKGLREAIKRAEDSDVLFVTAAGNDGTDDDQDPSYPASMNAPNMLTVTATDSKDELASFSNTGLKSVHLAAPGVDIYSTTPGNEYQRMSGTSMACPHAAGAAALLWSAHPNWTYKEVKARLLESVDKVPALNGKTITGGRLNVARALLN